MEPTIPLHQVPNIIRSTSPTSPRNSTFRNHPSLPDDHNRIRLNLAQWENILVEPINTENLARHRIDKILNFFINVASANDLTITPAVQSLRECKSYFAAFAGPTTVAASWKEETQSQLVSIAFTTTAIGMRRGDNTREVMAAARREFMTTLSKTFKNESKTVNNRFAPNREGNCPEYMTWPVVCRQEGRYQSLYLIMHEEWAYRCCGHCERTLEKLGANNIQIDD